MFIVLLLPPPVNAMVQAHLRGERHPFCRAEVQQRGIGEVHDAVGPILAVVGALTLTLTKN